MAKVEVTAKIIDDNGNVSEARILEGQASLVCVGGEDGYNLHTWLNPLEHAVVMATVIEDFVDMHKKNGLSLTTARKSIDIAVERAFLLAELKESEDDNDDNTTTN